MSDELLHVHGVAPETKQEGVTRLIQGQSTPREYSRQDEKKCRRKIKSGRIPFLPEASVWIRRKQVYESLLRYKLGKIWN